MPLQNDLQQKSVKKGKYREATGPKSINQKFSFKKLINMLRNLFYLLNNLTSSNTNNDEQQKGFGSGQGAFTLTGADISYVTFHIACMSILRLLECSPF